MGFSANLQGKSSHEALIARQDSELRLLENLKRWLVLRIKCDRDYASALASLTSVTSKFDKSDELSASSPFTQAVLTAVENSDSLASIFKQNADHLSNITLEKLNAILNDKRSSRKFYQEEYNRLVAESVALHESLHRAKNEYEKSVESYKAAYVKYEELLASNAKSKGTSKKSEEVVKEKFQRAVKRLHIAHNDYVLLLLETADYERDFRTVLLPGLLEFQQAVQEDILLQCHTVIKEISQYSDLSSDPFRLLFTLLRTRVDAINPESEFKEFIEKNKSAPAIAQPPIFDAKLSALQHQDSSSTHSSNPLRPDRVAVDDLTLEALKNKLRLLEQRLSAVQSELALKQAAFNKLEADLIKLKKENSSETELSVLRRQVEGQRRQVGELRCSEQKWQRQVDTIGEAVAALSGQVPQGCELHLNNETVSTSVSLDELSPSLMTSGFNNTSLGKRRGQSLVDMFKRPFSRKSMTPPASPGCPSKQANLPAGKEGMVLAEEEVSSSAADVAEAEDVSVAPALPVPTNTEMNGQTSVPETFPLPLPPTPTESQSSNIASGLSDMEWFHGVLPREEVVRLLVNDGDYLVRETMRHEERQVVLSVSWAGHKHFIVQTTAEGLYRFEGPAFPTVQELIAHQQDSGLPVTTKSGAILKRAVPRETWEMNNDDVELVEKIGSGNFGDVYRARLRPTGVPVAVKTCRHTLPDEQKKKFLQEGRILKQYEHPNVVRLIGICVQKQPIMIVMELVPGGSLLNYLRQKNVHLTVKQMLGMCADVASGMAYLESRNCIHRDLAVRNCLVGDNNVVKISDFGMSREEQEYIVSDGMKQIPIKWTAPEALNYGKYTSLCDVWSFGVLCWEVFSRGGTPYSGLSNTRSRQMISAGYRMPAPEGTPDEMYRLIRRCWEYEPERRPHFDEICKLIGVMIKETQ